MNEYAEMRRRIREQHERNVESIKHKIMPVTMDPEHDSATRKVQLQVEQEWFESSLRHVDELVAAEKSDIRNRMILRNYILIPILVIVAIIVAYKEICFYLN